MRKGVPAYKGTEEYVFISYSHNDVARVLPILEYLNKNGIRMWYDEGVEYGEEWSESIAESMKNCSICMIFHSSSSIKSRNCKQEVNYALKIKKEIILVYLEKVENTDGLNMQLSLFRPIYYYQFDTVEDFLETLIGIQNLKKCCNMRKEKNKKTEKEAESTIDEELENAFHELKRSLLEKKIEEIKGKKIMEAITENVKKNGVVLEKIYSLCPNGYYKNQKKEFWLVEPDNVKILLYRVDEYIQYKNFTKKYLCTLVEPVKKLGKKIAYCIDKLDTENNFVLLFFKNKEEGYVGTGLLVGDSLLVRKKPVVLKLSAIKVTKELQLCESLYDTSRLTKEERRMLFAPQKQKDEVRWFETDLNASIYIIDPETVTPVLRQPYYDESESVWKARVKIDTGKTYFAFQVRGDDGMETTTVLPLLERGKYYRLGKHGFPKDLWEAAKCFEEDGSAQALYEIAHMFKEEDIQDEKQFMYYLNQSASEGFEPAMVELALYSYYQTNELGVIGRMWLDKTVEADFAPGSFVLACLMDLEIIAGVDSEQIFELYYQAALKGYEPAEFRISKKVMHGLNREENLISKKDELYSHFVPFEKEDALYCLGSMLFFGLGIEKQKDKGIELLLKAANMGNTNAQSEVFKIYDLEEDVYSDKEQALKWLRILAEKNKSFYNELGNWLVDGVGCEISEENDQEAVRLWEEAALNLDYDAINNLGWAYKKGRGYHIDYANARRLFEKATEGAISSSYVNLGELYQYGLGVNVDLEKAAMYYRKGGELGNKRAKEKLQEIICSSSDT